MISRDKDYNVFNVKLKILNASIEEIYDKCFMWLQSGNILENEKAEITEAEKPFLIKAQHYPLLDGSGDMGPGGDSKFYEVTISQEEKDVVVHIELESLQIVDKSHLMYWPRFILSFAKSIGVKIDNDLINMLYSEKIVKSIISEKIFLTLSIYLLISAIFIGSISFNHFFRISFVKYSILYFIIAFVWIYFRTPIIKYKIQSLLN